jgi:hypothetical protein
MLPLKRLIKYIICKPKKQHDADSYYRIIESNSRINQIKLGLYLYLNYVSEININIYHNGFVYYFEFVRRYEYDDSGDLDEDNTCYTVKVGINDQDVLELEPSLTKNNLYYILYSHYDANWIRYGEKTMNKKTLASKIQYGKKFRDILVKCFEQIELRQNSYLNSLYK